MLRNSAIRRVTLRRLPTPPSAMNSQRAVLEEGAGGIFDGSREGKRRRRDEGDVDG